MCKLYKQNTQALSSFKPNPKICLHSHSVFFSADSNSIRRTVISYFIHYLFLAINKNSSLRPLFLCGNRVIHLLFVLNNKYRFFFAPNVLLCAHCVIHLLFVLNNKCKFFFASIVLLCDPCVKHLLFFTCS